MWLQADDKHRSAQLPKRFARGHCRAHGKIEAARTLLHRNGEPNIGGFVNDFRRSHRFPAKQKNIAIDVGKVGIACVGPGGEKKKTTPLAPTPRLKSLPGGMAGKRGALEIIHACPLQIPIRQIEPRRLDQINRETETGGETQNGSGVSWDVWLIKRDTHLAVSLDMAECGFPVTLHRRRTGRRKRRWRVTATVGIRPSLSTRTRGERHEYASTLHDLAPRLQPEGLTADSVRHGFPTLSGSFVSQSVGIVSRFPRTFAMHNRFPRRPFGRNNDYVVPQLDPTRPTLQDRRLEAWALTIRAITVSDREPQRHRPQRGQLPDVDMRHATPVRPALWTMLRKLFQ